MPDKLPNLPVGVYQLNPQFEDWKLPAETITLRPDENVAQVIKVPYATLNVQSVPPGATVRDGHTVLGQTPLTLPKERPGTLHLAVDLPPYTIQRLDVDLPAFGNVSKTVTLTQDKDFVGASGIDMVWIPDGRFLGGEVPDAAEHFRGGGPLQPELFPASRPAGGEHFVEQRDGLLRQADRVRARGGQAAGRVSLQLCRPSRSGRSSRPTLTSTRRRPRARARCPPRRTSGYSEPNKYGLYDTLGNVWEWCLDNYDDKGNHSLRGGNWLSSSADFPDAETRNGAAPTYADRFTGFRVVLVPNSKERRLERRTQNWGVRASALRSKFRFDVPQSQ